MMSGVGDWIRDNIDQINLFMIKILGTILTALAIIGYLDSVSKFDQLLIIHNLVVAFILLIVTLTGYSVYVYKMMTDISADATLLNYLYMVFAILGQIKTSLVFCWIVIETISAENCYTIFVIYCTYFVQILTVLTVSSIAGTTLIKSRTPEFYMDLSQKNPKIVMMIFGMNLLCTITLFFLGFQINFEERREHFRKILFLVIFASFCILLKVNEDEYGIAKRVMSSLGKMSRISNSVTPEIDVGEGMVENCTHPVNIKNSSQA